MNMFYGKTKIVLCNDPQALGYAAASSVADRIRRLLKEKNEIRIVFAAGESQSTFLNALASETEIDWARTDCFNIDDFWDINIPERFTCAYQTRKELYSKVNPGTVQVVRYNATAPLPEVERFEKLVKEKPIDIVCQGIGTSGHLALNEPFASDFNDTAWVRFVDVAEQSKKQLRDDPNFKELGYIPQKGITMTIPAIMSASYCYTMVPFGLKKEILSRLSEIKIPTVEVPASILLKKESCLFVDKDSCPDAWKLSV